MSPDQVSNRDLMLLNQTCYRLRDLVLNVIKPICYPESRIVSLRCREAA